MELEDAWRLLKVIPVWNDEEGEPCNPTTLEERQGSKFSAYLHSKTYFKQQREQRLSLFLAHGRRKVPFKTVLGFP